MSDYREKGGSVSPTPSCVSMKSNQSIGAPPYFSDEPVPSGTNYSVTDLPHRSPEVKIKKMSDYREEGGSVSPAPSCVSMKSNQSIGAPPYFSEEPVPSGTNVQTTQSVEQNQDTLKVFQSKAGALVNRTLRRYKKVLTENHKDLFVEEEKGEVTYEQVESNPEVNEALLKIAVHILRTMKKDELAYTLQKRDMSLPEGITKQGQSTPLNEVYTELYVIEGDSGGINTEHEVRQIETAFNRPASLETPIKCEDIFKPLLKQNKPIRTVLTKGIAGIGKTMLIQKFILDWSEDIAHQEIQLLFSLPFRALNLINQERRSLMELLCDFYVEFKESGIQDLEKYRVLFVLHGLDECRLPLDFQGNELCCDATQAASLDVLLTNLIAGKLLPKAYIWITTRPAAASCIPSKYINLVTEVRGFSDPQKEQYFNKKIEDVNIARKVIAHIKSARSLHIMCHVPVFCWISSIVLGKMCTELGRREMPKTLTQMYLHFLIFQTKQMNLKYREQQELASQKIIMSLGKLAFQQLEKGNLNFYEEDLRSCGIDVREASIYSGVCTEFFREEFWLHHKVFCFVHLSIQEFLAALYVYLMYMNQGVNLMIQQHDTSAESQMPQTRSVAGLHKAAVDRALQSDNGHLDLFLRFLLGLSLESNQALIRGLMIQVEGSGSHSHKETIMYIKEKIRENPHPERCINLFHCLNELNDHSWVEEIQSYLRSEQDSVMDLCSPAQWSALVFVLLTSEDKLEVFDLKKYTKTEKGLLRLLPVVKASRSAMLNDCNLTETCCEALSSALSSTSYELRDLNLSDNNLEDSGVKLLCTGLQSKHCSLRKLRLNRCSLTQRCCEELASVLSCHSSHLRELDLSDNDIEDTGVKQLCTGLGSLHCKLENLRLSFCGITAEGCGFLATAVKSNPSHLRELDLSYNHLGETGVKLISEALEEGHCTLTKLSVDHNAECWLKSGLRKYACEFTVDPNTAHKLLILSDRNRKITQVKEEQPYLDHPDRFDHWTQVLSQEGLTGRCFWEAEWEGKWAGLGVTYKGIGRKGVGNDCVMGYNEMSWGLHCSAHGYRAYHNYESIVLQVPLAGCRRLAVFLDWPAGILSFYRVSSGRSLTHLYTFYTTFTEPLHPIFKVWGQGSSMRLC